MPSVSVPFGFRFMRFYFSRVEPMLAPDYNRSLKKGHDPIILHLYSPILGNDLKRYRTAAKPKVLQSLIEWNSNVSFTQFQMVSIPRCFLLPVVRLSVDLSFLDHRPTPPLGLTGMYRYGGRSMRIFLAFLPACLWSVNGKYGHASVDQHVLRVFLTF